MIRNRNELQPMGVNPHSTSRLLCIEDEAIVSCYGVLELYLASRSLSYCKVGDIDVYTNAEFRQLLGRLY